MIEKDPNGKFKKGVVTNPIGRAKGPMTNNELTKLIMQSKQNRNQFTMALFDRIESLGDSLLAKAVDMAKEGNEKMLLFLLEKMINPNLMNRLEKPLKSKTVEQIDDSSQFIIEKMGDGEIDTQHGERLIRSLALKRDTINVKDLEDKVRKIVENE